jgi:hypothetical protein
MRFSNMMLLLLTLYKAWAYTCPKFPRGTFSTASSIEYYALDVYSSTGAIVVGGQCSDTALCGSIAPNPIVEFIDPTTL